MRSVSTHYMRNSRKRRTRRRIARLRVAKNFKSGVSKERRKLIIAVKTTCRGRSSSTKMLSLSAKDLTLGSVSLRTVR